jgi:copper chaperone NosL
MRTCLTIFFLLPIIFLFGCKHEFEPVNYGHDACMQCKMTILDKRYAAEVITKKGKVLKFDDIACLKKYIGEEHMEEQVQKLFVADYNNPDGNFLDAAKALYLHNELFRSPMNGNYGAFASAEDAKKLADSLNGSLLSWNKLN